MHGLGVGRIPHVQTVAFELEPGIVRFGALEDGAGEHIAFELARGHIIGHDLPGFQQFGQDLTITDMHILRFDTAVLDEHGPIHAARNKQAVGHEPIDGESRTIPHIDGRNVAVHVKLLP